MSTREGFLICNPRINIACDGEIKVMSLPGLRYLEMVVGM
jgi:hypothetical protein